MDNGCQRLFPCMQKKAGHKISPITCKSEDRTITDSLRRNYNHNIELGLAAD